jgi:hypothetical protein
MSQQAKTNARELGLPRSSPPENGHLRKNNHYYRDQCKESKEHFAKSMHGIWRVMSGLRSSIEFYCMEAAHTKCHPDWHFGLWKVLAI